MAVVTGFRSAATWVQEQHHQLHMQRWMLDFDEAEAEEEFRAYDNLMGLAQAWFALAIALLLDIGYGVVDVLLLDDGLREALLVRAGAAALIVVSGLVMARSTTVSRHPQFASFLLLTLLLLWLGTGLGLAADFPLEYLRTSCTITLLGAVGLLRLRMHAALGMAGAYVVVCLTLPGTGGFGRDPGVIAAEVTPVLGLAAIAVLVAYALERVRRTEFERQREVEIEQARSDELLHNVLPVAIASRLRTAQGTIAESAEEVSVLFSDIVGFTAIAEHLPAERLVGLLDTMFREFDALCDRRGVEKIKTVGDAYMAVAGLPTPDVDHAASLAELALDMQRASARLARDWPGPIAMRIGIASGPVVAGVIGRRKFTYDLWGDTVNTASRMESHGRPHRIQVSERTHELLADRYAFSDAQQVEVKGKGPMTTYFLLGRMPL